MGSETIVTGRNMSMWWSGVCMLTPLPIHLLHLRYFSFPACVSPVFRLSKGHPFPLSPTSPSPFVPFVLSVVSTIANEQCAGKSFISIFASHVFFTLWYIFWKLVWQAPMLPTAVLVLAIASSSCASAHAALSSLPCILLGTA